ncbi:TIGR02452 family protein [Collinsella sp. An2]|uniref:TIGR02452 family protein n=1 Tax=Collinsella sp. An2 TaxID=1965585 RepID=UPI000B371C17|nr:TIGR02452 family protein [Collinsella sp. An2]OUP06072.1 TIGR02452 family protein [Collinsella sp. An2]
MAEQTGRRPLNGRNNPRRDARREAAERHTEDVARRCAKDIERSLAGVVRIEGLPTVEVGEPVVPEVAVVAQDAVSAIVENGRGYAQFCDMAVLDFASFVTPAGGYIRGAWAQEQALCANSYLHNVLDTQRDWYGENRRRNINCELYRNRALVVPAVRFERDHVHAYADVIVAAAPDAKRARDEYHVDEATLDAAMRDRIRFVLGIIDQLGREKAVLGAYGCGAFGWDAERVAELFRAELADGSHGVKQVIFAVPRTRYDDNLAKFEHAFSAFPEPPATSYSEAAAAAAAERQAREAAAATADDEEEDDWRNYL